MIELSIFQLILATLGGGIVGLIFFGGLKFTVDRLQNSSHPALLLVSSLLLRFAVVLIAAYLTINHVHWQALLLALPGFVGVRLMLSRSTIKELSS